MYNKEFWLAAFERAVSTFVQTFLGVWVALGITTTQGLDWGMVGGAAGAAAVLSILKSLIAGFNNGNPSVGNLEVATPETPDDVDIP